MVGSGLPIKTGLRLQAFSSMAQMEPQSVRSRTGGTGQVRIGGQEVCTPAQQAAGILRLLISQGGVISHQDGW